MSHETIDAISAVKRRKFICRTLHSSPVAHLAFKVREEGAPDFIREIEVDGKKQNKTINQYRSIDFPREMTRFNGPEDSHGQVIPGAIVELSDKELEDLKRDIERRVVRWKGEEKRQGAGVGPGRRYVTGSIIVRQTFEGRPAPRYRAQRGDEPLMKYIDISAISEDDVSKLVNRNFVSSQGGWNVDIKIDRASLEDQIARLQKQLDSIKARDEAAAEKSEQETVKEQGKRRGRPRKIN